MRFPDIDSYIATFEQTIRKALYRLGSHEMNQQFLSGLPRDVAEDVMHYPTPIMYQEHTEKPLQVYDQKYYLGMYSEEIGISEHSPLSSNAHNGIARVHRIKTHPNIIHQMPHDG